MDRVQWVRRLAHEAGFDLVGAAAAEPVGHRDYLARWLAEGRYGAMDYLARTWPTRLDPRKLLPGARSIIVVAHNYRPSTEHRPASGEGAAPSAGGGPCGRIARYAWGRDYHRVVAQRLRRLLAELRRVIAEPFEARIGVDTAPVLERAIAAAAGIGWIGKNTMVIHPVLGSFFFLGEIVTTLDLPASPRVANRCGSCRRCLDACPTGCFTGPYRMDPRRCIAYLTIEHRGPIPAPLEAGVGDRLFGCDVCQEVCPYNRSAPATREPAYGFQERNPLPPRPRIKDVLGLTDADRRRYLAGSAMNRATLAMLHRNAAQVLRNARRS